MPAVRVDTNAAHAHAHTGPPPPPPPPQNGRASAGSPNRDAAASSFSFACCVRRAHSSSSRCRAARLSASARCTCNASSIARRRWAAASRSFASLVLDRHVRQPRCRASAAHTREASRRATYPRQQAAMQVDAKFCAAVPRTRLSSLVSSERSRRYPGEAPTLGDGSGNSRICFVRERRADLALCAAAEAADELLTAGTNGVRCDLSALTCVRGAVAPAPLLGARDCPPLDRGFGVASTSTRLDCGLLFAPAGPKPFPSASASAAAAAAALPAPPASPAAAHLSSAPGS